MQQLTQNPVIRGYLRYRLFHTRLGKFVAWPHGRGYIKREHGFSCISSMMPMLRIENAAWGGTDDMPVLEIHAVSDFNGSTMRRYSLTQHSFNLTQYQLDYKKGKRAAGFKRAL